MKHDIKKEILERGNYTPVPNDFRGCDFKQFTHARLHLLHELLYHKQPIRPSYRNIKKNAGLSKDSVNKGIKDFIKWNMLRIEQGGPNRANRYYFRPMAEWVIPQVQQSKPDEKSSLVSEIGQTVERAMYPGEQSNSACSPGTYNTKDKTNKKRLNQKTKINNSKNFSDCKISQVADWKMWHFKEELKYLYSAVCMKEKKISYPKDKLVDLESQDFLDKVFDLSIEYSSLGGTLHGLVVSEFDRLKGKKTEYFPKPDFLSGKHSKEQYLLQLSSLRQCSYMCASIDDLIAPFDRKFLSVNPREDYQSRYAYKSVREFMKVKDVKNYEQMRWKEKPSEILQIGPYIFHYIIIKLILFNGAISMALSNAANNYFESIGSYFMPPQKYDWAEDNVVNYYGVQLDAYQCWEKYCLTQFRTTAQAPVLDEIKALKIPPTLMKKVGTV